MIKIQVYVKNVQMDTISHKVNVVNKEQDI